MNKLQARLKEVREMRMKMMQNPMELPPIAAHPFSDSVDSPTSNEPKKSPIDRLTNI